MPMNLDTEHSCNTDQYWDENDSTCYSCDSPCASCFKQASFCLSCISGYETEQLDDGYVDCNCAAETYDVAGVCTPCDPICSEGC